MEKLNLHFETLVKKIVETNPTVATHFFFLERKTVAAHVNFTIVITN